MKLQQQEVYATFRLDAIEFLRLLTDPDKPDHDPSHAMLAEEVIRHLRASGKKAVGAHAAVILQCMGGVAH